jgi:hypothetical protein
MKKIKAERLEELRKLLAPMLDDSHKKVWDILSALRGPDDEERRPKDTKAATTGIIRYMVFRDDASFGVITFRDCAAYAAIRRRLPRAHDHFSNHARHAFEVLGLKWRSVNKLPKPLL